MRKLSNALGQEGRPGSGSRVHPSGGSTADVETKNTLILSNDPVAADGVGALLFGRKPEEIGFIRLAQKQGLGTYDPAKIDQRQVSV